MLVKKYLLEITVFVCGAVVMIFEMVGSKIFAPYLGTSIFVWTSLIGVILGSLSFGYWLGGKVSDKRPDWQSFSFVILLTAVLFGLVIMFKDLVLLFFQRTHLDIRWSSVWGSLILFSGPSILMGMISPYAVRLKMKDLNTTGATVGNLYAISTLGSIVGTFLAGFYLVPFFGTAKVLLFLLIVLLVLSFIVYPANIIKAKIGYKILLAYILLTIGGVYFFDNAKNYTDINTPYNYIRIFDTIYAKTNTPIRVLQMNGGNHSAMFLDSDELVFEYPKYYDLAEHFKPDFKNSLLIGAGAYSYPRHYLSKFPDKNLDTVEIDAGLADISKKFFKLTDNPRLNIYHEDGRIFLNQNQKKYDVIFGDAFGSFYSIPHHLTTIEAVQKIYDNLNSDGMVLANVISAIDGDKGKFFRAEYATYKDVFPQVYVFVTDPETPSSQPQNLIIVAFKSKSKPDFNSDDENINKYLKNLWQQEIATDMPILTDEYAPVDYYMSGLL